MDGCLANFQCTYAHKCVFLSPKFLLILRTLSLNQDFPLFNSFVTESRLDLRMKKYASLDVWCCGAAFNTNWTPLSQESSHVLCTGIAIIIYSVWHQNNSHSLEQLSNPCNSTPTQTWSYCNDTSIDEKSSRQSYKLRLEESAAVICTEGQVNCQETMIGLTRWHLIRSVW